MTNEDVDNLKDGTRLIVNCLVDEEIVGTFFRGPSGLPYIVWQS